ncbi:hypothetical protein NIES2098_73000 (plasmid) [Calothrix sp. NIES-2098]|nr:hypothetical protein NIES2098_73000 [Calothrix sp. NIES-2098]
MYPITLFVAARCEKISGTNLTQPLNIQQPSRSENINKIQVMFNVFTAVVILSEKSQDIV